MKLEFLSSKKDLWKRKEEDYSYLIEPKEQEECIHFVTQFLFNSRWLLQKERGSIYRCLSLIGIHDLKGLKLFLQGKIQLRTSFKIGTKLRCPTWSKTWKSWVFISVNPWRGIVGACWPPNYGFDYFNQTPIWSGWSWLSG